MKKTYTIYAALIVIAAVILTGCKNEQPLSKENEAAKVSIRIVGIDSTSGARTEDKVLFVNVK